MYGPVTIARPRWQEQDDREQEHETRYILGALAGLLTGALGAFAIGLAAAEVFSISQAEGAYMMGLVFFWLPLGAVIGAVLGVIALRLRR